MERWSRDLHEFHVCMSFNQPLEAWDVGQATVIGMTYMFTNAAAINQPLEIWDMALR